MWTHRGEEISSEPFPATIGIDSLEWGVDTPPIALPIIGCSIRILLTASSALVLSVATTVGI